jgi:hypothetical protein
LAVPERRFFRASRRGSGRQDGPRTALPRSDAAAASRKSIADISSSRDNPCGGLIRDRLTCAGRRMPAGRPDRHLVDPSHGDDLVILPRDRSPARLLVLLVRVIAVCVTARARATQSCAWANSTNLSALLCRPDVMQPAWPVRGRRSRRSCATHPLVRVWVESGWPDRQLRIHVRDLLTPSTRTSPTTVAGAHGGVSALKRVRTGGASPVTGPVAVRGGGWVHEPGCARVSLSVEVFGTAVLRRARAGVRCRARFRRRRESRRW